MDTKEQILEASLKLMNKFGYGSLSLTEIATVTGVTKQRVYYHFKSVDDILVLLAQEWSKTGQAFTMEALAHTHNVGAMKLLAMTEGMFNWMREKSELSRLGVVIFQSAPHIKELEKFISNAKNAGRERIRGILTQDSTFSKMSKKKLDDVITAFHSLMYGHYFYVITMNDFTSIDKHQENCDRSILKLLESF